MSGTPPAKARVAVIGCGSWATEAHLPALTRNPQAEVIAVVDPFEVARDVAARRFGVGHAFATHEELFVAERPDAVVVATPHAHHYRPVRAALDAGAHVLVEKPMVLEGTQARELLDLGRERGVELIVGYPWHYNRQALLLRRMIEEGRLGELEFVSCLFASMVRAYYEGDTATYQPELGLTLAPRNETYSDPRLAGGGQGQTQVTHSAALLFWLTGLRPTRVAAFCQSFGLRVDLVDAVAVQFDDGAVGMVGSTGDRPSGHEDLLELRICGNRGIAHFDVMAGDAMLSLPDGKVERFEALPVDERYPHWAPADNLVDVTLGEAPNGSPVELGCVVVEFLEAMYASAAAGGTPVELSPLG